MSLDEEFKTLETRVRNGAQITGGSDAREMLGIALLGQAVVKLDKTSRLLTLVNIGLTIVLAVIGAVQIWLMVHGHG